MGELCRVFYIGESLFIDALAQVLVSEPWITPAGAAPSPEAAVAELLVAQPDLVILAYAGNQPPPSPDRILELCPDTPIVLADLSRDYVQVITSQRVGARRDDLVGAIRAVATGRELSLGDR